MRLVLWMGLAGVLCGPVMAHAGCTEVAKRPLNSSSWDPFHLGFAKAMTSWRRGCTFTTISEGRVSVKNLRAVMDKAQFKACAQLTSHGKEPYQRVVKTVKTDADKASLFALLGIDSGEKRKKVASVVADWGGQEAVGMLVGTVPFGGTVKSGVDLALAIAENSCGVQSVKRAEERLDVLIAKGGRLTYDVNLTRGVNRRGEPLLQEVLAYQVKVGDELRVVPLMRINLLVKLK